jgi:predicted N-acetyltransferase YhbS
MSMDVKLRPVRPEDTNACGRICYEAFAGIAAAHGYPCDFPSPDVARALVAGLIAHPGVFGVVADADDVVVGSNFLDERTTIAGVGPITVDPSIKSSGVGRQLMEAVMERAADQRSAGVRLVQTAYNTRSLALYASLGFQVRETLACLQGPPLGITIEGFSIRTAGPADEEPCNELCRRVHGHDRAPQLSDALFQERALVVEHDGRVTGYSTGLAFFSHSVGENTDDIRALIGAASEFGGSGILVPMRNAALFRFCLAHGLHVVQVMTLMTTGLYNEPQGAYLPSIMY